MRLTAHSAIAASLILPLLCLGLAAQQNGGFYFIQMSDPQFGFFNSDKSFEQETANLEFVVANLNRIKPAFVVVCGDLVNKPGDAAQIGEYKRIMAKLNPAITVYNVAGNHDVENEPTPQTIAAYREAFGPDYYSFRRGDFTGIVLDSNLIAAPAKAQAAAAEQEKWLKEELAKAKSSGTKYLAVFLHHPFFLAQGDEADQYFNIPLERRKGYLDMFKEAGVSHIFAGHLHRNAEGKDGPLQMITTGPIGRPLGSDPSGIRVVLVRPTGIEHRYVGLGSIPFQVQLTTPPPAAKKQ
jgi:serine/threonine-protein phosphatase CPPED1